MAFKAQAAPVKAGSRSSRSTYEPQELGADGGRDRRSRTAASATATSTSSTTAGGAARTRCVPGHEIVGNVTGGGSGVEHLAVGPARGRRLAAQRLPRVRALPRSARRTSARTQRPPASGITAAFAGRIRTRRALRVRPARRARQRRGRAAPLRRRHRVRAAAPLRDRRDQQRRRHRDRRPRAHGAADAARRSAARSTAFSSSPRASATRPWRWAPHDVRLLDRAEARSASTLGASTCCSRRCTRGSTGSPTCKTLKAQRDALPGGLAAGRHAVPRGRCWSTGQRSITGKRHRRAAAIIRGDARLRRAPQDGAPDRAHADGRGQRRPRRGCARTGCATGWCSTSPGSEAEGARGSRRAARSDETKWSERRLIRSDRRCAGERLRLCAFTGASHRLPERSDSPGRVSRTGRTSGMILRRCILPVCVRGTGAFAVEHHLGPRSRGIASTRLPTQIVELAGALERAPASM